MSGHCSPLEEDWDNMSEEALLAAIERQQEELQAVEAESKGAHAPGHASATSAGGASNSTKLTAETLQRMEALEQEHHKLQEENAAMKEALMSGKGLSALDSRTRSLAASSVATNVDSVLRASAARRKAMAGGLLSAADLERQVAAKKKLLAVKQRGVDICVMMDCTGSMSGCIEAVKRQALDIMKLAPSVDPDAITRLAFVGYRDYPPEQGFGQHVVQDFVSDESNFSLIQDKVQPLRASGGGDAEDVTGALKKVTELSWSSSTRVLIHFGDMPCHGSAYHAGRPARFHGGDPTGLVPEELLRELIRNRISYHFARITPYTDVMTRIFQSVYDEAPGAATFEMHDMKDQASDFLPLVLKSVTSSMRRSHRTSSARSSASNSKASTTAPGLVLPSLYARLV